MIGHLCLKCGGKMYYSITDRTFYHVKSGFNEHDTREEVNASTDGAV